MKPEKQLHRRLVMGIERGCWIDSGLDLALSWHEVFLAIAKQFPTAPGHHPLIASSLPPPTQIHTHKQ